MIASAAVVGSITIDTVVHGGARTTKPGGASIYAALAYAEHGLETHVVSGLAREDAWIADAIGAKGVRVHARPAETTTHFVNTYDEDERRTQELTSYAPAVDARALEETIDLDAIDLVHLGPLHALDVDRSACERIARSRAIVALDVQGAVRRIEGKRVVGGLGPAAHALLGAARFAKASRRELGILLDGLGLGLGRDGRALMERYALSEIVVTDGPLGGTVLARGAEPIHYEATAVSAPWDPTGAGDVFFAAYLVARTRDGLDIAAAAAHAADRAAAQLRGDYVRPDALAASVARRDAC